MPEPSRSFSTTRLSVSPVGMGSWREAYRSNRRVLSSASTMARERTRIGASVVVSKFATFRYRSSSELRNQNDTRNQYVASVLSIPKFAKRRYRDVANFGIGTLGSPDGAVSSRGEVMIERLANFLRERGVDLNTF